MSNVIGAVFSIRDQFSSQVRNITRATGQAEAEVTQASGAVRRFGSSFRDNISSGVNRVRDSFNDTEEETDEATRSIDDFNSSLDGGKVSGLTSKIAGLVAGFVSIGAVVGVAKQAISGAADMENYRNTLNIVMKDEAKAAQMMKYSIDMANKTPFNTEDIVQGNVKLVSYGLDAVKVGTQVGNMAATMNKSYDQAVEAIADAQTGEVERLKEFGITKQNIIDHADKIMKGKEIVNKQGQITDQEAFNETLFNLMDDKYAGAMDAQANTFSGAMSTMKGMTSSALSQLAGITEEGTVKAGGALDILKNKVVDITGAIQKWADAGGVDRATKKIEKGFKIAGNAVKSLIPIYNSTLSVIKSSVKFYQENEGAIKKVGAAITLFFLPGLASLAKVAIIAQLNALKTAFIGIGDKAIWSAAKISFNFFKSLVQVGIQATIAAAKLVGSIVKAIVVTGAKAVVAGAQMAVSFVGALIKIAARATLAAAKLVIMTVSFVAQTTAMIVSKVAMAAVTVAQWALNAAMSANPIVLVVGLLIGLGVALVAVYKKNETFRNIVNKAWDAIKEKCGTVVDYVKEKWNSVVDAFEKVGTKVKDMAKTITDKWQKVKDFMANPISGTINMIQNSVGGGAPDGEHRTGKNRIPFDGYRAVLHEDEMVLNKRDANDYRKGNINNKSIMDSKVPKTKNLFQNVIQVTKNIKSEQFPPLVQEVTKGKDDSNKQTLNESKAETNIVYQNNEFHISATIREESDITKLGKEVARQLKIAKTNTP